MNPLGSLPGASSTPGTLNTLDWQKILRALLVQLISAFVVLAPKLAGMTYIYKGTDYTPAVLIVMPINAPCCATAVGPSTAIPDVPI